ncbi:hypothetical protein HZB78_00070 [Candidatus Collierbacteria bacterium]|nr:hypothetical protein [Candidatus Collierbacteria bacterium]
MNLVVQKEKIFIPREWLIVVIMTFLMAGAWIGVSVYYVLTKPNIVPAQAERLKEISPVLDKVILQDLGSRKQRLELSSSEKAQ